MAGKPVRAVVVGASTPLGKELADQLNVAAGGWDLSLVEEEGEGGQITAAGDEALVVSSLSSDTFTGADLVCFAGDPEVTRKVWHSAQEAGACIVDMSGALEEEKGAVVLAPGVGNAPADLRTSIAIPAHPAALILAAVLQPVRRVLGDVACAATVLTPASHWGEAGIDELHRQTVSLLSFHNVPKDFFDVQSAFSVVSSFGAGSKASLAAEEHTVRRHLRALAGADASAAIQVLQAPVFHGLTVSIWIATRGDGQLAVLLNALRDQKLLVLPEDESEEVSNTSASGQPSVLVRAHADESGEGIWLWLAADNLQLAAVNGVACATELMALKPHSTLQ